MQKQLVKKEAIFEFEEQEGVCGRAERKEREGRNIIVKY